MSSNGENGDNGANIADAVAAKLIAALGNNAASDNDIERLIDLFQDQSDRYHLARTLIDLIVPDTIDVDLWRALALGENIDLPASDQYGPIASRLKPPEPKGRRASAGNIYGRVHSKGAQAPSEFMRRQGQFLAANAREIEQAKQRLADLEQQREEIGHGLFLYAVTMLLTAMKKAVAPVFAMGPAWTLLEAIQGPAAGEIDPADRPRDTHRILVVLHALRADEAFRADLKAAILAVCQRYAGAAARSHRNPFDGPYDYEQILAHLGWPDTPDTWPR